MKCLFQFNKGTNLSTYIVIDIYLYQHELCFNKIQFSASIDPSQTSL